MGVPRMPGPEAKIPCKRKRWRERQIRLHNCTMCGRKSKKLSCPECLARQRDRQKEYYARLSRKMLCRGCRKQMNEAYVFCTECSMKARERRRVKKKRLIGSRGKKA